MIIIKEAISNDDIDRMVRDIKSDLRKKYPAGSGDFLTIKASKDVAKKIKIPYQDVLKLFKPDNNISGEKTWDKNGNIK